MFCQFALMTLRKPSDLIRFTLCPQRINTYTCHLHKDRAICRESATQSRTGADPVAVRQHTSPAASSICRLQAEASRILKHQTRLHELWAPVLFGCHRGCVAHPHDTVLPILPPAQSLPPLGSVCLLPKCTSNKISWAGKSLRLGRSRSLFGQHGWTSRKLQPHGCRCTGLVLTFHAEGNTRQMTDPLGHVHMTPHAARLVSLKHLFP